MRSHDYDIKNHVYPLTNVLEIDTLYWYEDTLMPNPNGENHKNKPPYIPFATFKAFIATLKNTTIPSRIDSSVTPTMSGQMRGALNTCLTFLRLIDAEKNVMPALEFLVDGYEGETWKSAIGALTEDAYAPILAGLTIKNATGSQLNERFRDNGGVDGQVLEKAVRFYLSALDDAGIEYSKLLQQRGATTVRKRGTVKRAKGKKVGDVGASAEVDSDESEIMTTPPAEGLVPFVIPFPDKPAARFWLPKSLDEDDWAMIDAMGRAYVKRNSKANA